MPKSKINSWYGWVPDRPDFRDKLYVKIGGKEQAWKLEEEKPPEFVFDWPGDGGASIRLVRQQGKVLGIFGSSDEDVYDEKSFDGSWGLFRLIGASAKSGTSGRAEVKCLWTFKDGVVVSGVLRTDKGFSNPLARNISVDVPERLNDTRDTRDTRTGSLDTGRQLQ